eukprot:Skav200172  [mRNA]  locus=scaffold1159:114968:116703:- [translate_table: standard]
MPCFRCTGPAILQRRRAALHRERTSTLQAVQMHETVNPARWCVTFADLQFLELEPWRTMERLGDTVRIQPLSH